MGRLAQLVERRLYTANVGSSSLSPPTILIVCFELAWFAPSGMGSVALFGGAVGPVGAVVGALCGEGALSFRFFIISTVCRFLCEFWLFLRYVFHLRRMCALSRTGVPSMDRCSL